jgi:hypothetical protein
LFEEWGEFWVVGEEGLQGVEVLFYLLQIVISERGKGGKNGSGTNGLMLLKVNFCRSLAFFTEPLLHCGVDGELFADCVAG